MQSNPIDWAKAKVIAEATWPVLVGAAFWVGRLVAKLEQRLAKAEGKLDTTLRLLDTVINRHLPAVHKALAEIRGLLTVRR